MCLHVIEYLRNCFLLLFSMDARKLLNLRQKNFACQNNGIFAMQHNLADIFSTRIFRYFGSQHFTVQCKNKTKKCPTILKCNELHTYFITTWYKQDSMCVTKIDEIFIIFSLLSHYIYL